MHVQMLVHSVISSPVDRSPRRAGKTLMLSRGLRLASLISGAHAANPTRETGIWGQRRTRGHGRQVTPPCPSAILNWLATEVCLV